MPEPSPKLRFASLTLAYNQEDYLEYCLRSIAPFAGTLFVMFSKRPWVRYNPVARQEFQRLDNTGRILARLQADLPHLRVITGEWDCEEDMRNEGLAAAREAGYDFLLVVDADEFYRGNDLALIQVWALHVPVADSWWCRMCFPFKYCDYVVDKQDHYLPVVIRTQSDVKFVNRRILDGRRGRLPQRFVCFNMGFVLSDSRMYEKIRTYGHAHELPERWFEEKWLAWTPDTKNLHTRTPHSWPGTHKYDPRGYPEILKGHPLLRRYGDQESTR